MHLGYSLTYALGIYRQTFGNLLGADWALITLGAAVRRRSPWARSRGRGEDLLAEPDSQRPAGRVPASGRPRFLVLLPRLADGLESFQVSGLPVGVVELEELSNGVDRPLT